MPWQRQGSENRINALKIFHMPLKNFQSKLKYCQKNMIGMELDLLTVNQVL